MKRKMDENWNPWKNLAKGIWAFLKAGGTIAGAALVVWMQDPGAMQSALEEAQLDPTLATLGVALLVSVGRMLSNGWKHSSPKRAQ